FGRVRPPSATWPVLGGRPRARCARSGEPMLADRQKRLHEAYRRAYEAGGALLKALQDPPAPARGDQVDERARRRDGGARGAGSLFLPGDEVRFREELHALAEQQQALDAEMRRFMAELARISNAAAEARSVARSARQVMKSGYVGRMLDEKRWAERDETRSY